MDKKDFYVPKHALKQGHDSGFGAYPVGLGGTLVSGGPFSGVISAWFVVSL